MLTRSRNPFTTVTTSGLLLPIDLLTRVVEGDPDLPGLSPKDYHLRSGERLNEAASRAWNECLASWRTFRKRFADLPASDAGTTVTRDEWLLPLFQELGYGRLQPKKAIEIDGKEYPISHGWENHVPIHLLSAKLPLDRRTPGVSGAATRAPYSLLQEQLNRSSQHRWGFVSNGLQLFLLRDNAALARAANVEFDLEAMMDGEVYSDFILIFLLCHQSRVEIHKTAAGCSDRGTEKGKVTAAGAEGNDGGPEDCWLEKWANLADQQGTRARERLRDGVEAAIKSLGAGFLTTKGNITLRERLRTGELSTQDYYRQLLRVVYRLLMLLVAEEKRTENGQNLFHPPGTPLEVRDKYARFYSVGRVRTLAYERRGTAHTDLYESLKILFRKLQEGYAPLGIPGMGSFLYSADSTPELDQARLANQDLLDAFRHLCYTEDTSGRGGGFRRPVDFGHLGSEELGSVYESLLELHPQIDTEAGPFTLGTAAGHERKTTGSYYTPRSLINCLLDSALDPVVNRTIDTPDTVEAEQKLLDLKICDPACGSGHFLIAAVERMATHLARLRTGDDQPNTLAVQHAKRDIIGRCIYGVDVNPMAVELCKVSLWMEALEPGKPLSFLDHHIQCGNSLLGATPRLLEDGVPNEAFKVVEGDDKTVCSELKRNNRKQRKDYAAGYRDLHPIVDLGDLPQQFATLTRHISETVDDTVAKAKLYAELVKHSSYENARLLADYWCAAFVWKKVASELGALCPTERDYRQFQTAPSSILPNVKSEVQSLADQYLFFHWHLAFPDVFRLSDDAFITDNVHAGWNGGFDVILGNPPWESAEIKEKEWFSSFRPEIAKTKTASARKKLISELATNDPGLFRLFSDTKRQQEARSHFVKSSGRFPLCGKGKTNLYALMVETMRMVLNRRGSLGCVVPPGIATDDGNKEFIQQVVEDQTLASFYDFTNRGYTFPGVESTMSFSLLTLANSGVRSFRLSAQLWRTTDLNDTTRIYDLTKFDIRQINPNTHNLPIVRSKKDAVLMLHCYEIAPVLVRDSDGSNPWKIDLRQGLFNMTTDSGEFRTREELEDSGWQLTGNLFVKNDATYVPLYESKLANQFNHRAASFDTAEADRMFGARAATRQPSASELANPRFVPIPRYWVKQPLVSENRLSSWSNDWFIGFRRTISAVADSRSALFFALPAYGVGDSVFLIYSQLDAALQCGLLWQTNSFLFDYVTRQKASGGNLSFYVVKQLPLISPQLIEAGCPWASGTSIEWIVSRVLELSFTAWDMSAFAADCGHAAPPFCWNEERRFQIRCELDAAYYHLYFGSEHQWGADNPQLREMFPTPRDAVDYIMDTFPIVRRKDEAKYDGDYRTKRTILEIYDKMAEAIRTGQPYQTQLDPPPGPPTDAEGDFTPMASWDQANWPPHIHPPLNS
ncbi:N-6 DNA methylase [Bremerella sp. JC770]|uniref:Eco57I restriction-modification methylase domain-containing protein n=1 Tax=Bremerella sp. JC770 TaxID=3232137 RepID=UPI00345AE3B1